MLDAYIAGIGITKLGKFSDKSVKDLTRTAVDRALADAGSDMRRIEAAWFSNTRQGIMEGQNVIRGQCALRSYGFEGIPITNVENACASGSTAIRDAAIYVSAGHYNIVLVAGADKMFFPDNREGMMRAFRGGVDVGNIDGVRAVLSQMSDNCDEQQVSATQGHSLFMDIYAAMARLHMRKFGTTQRQMAAAAAKNHYHSSFNPYSQYQRDMSLEEVLGDRIIAWPLTKSMCAPISDGAAAAVICNSRGLRILGANGRAIRIAAISLCSSSNRDVADFDRHIGRRAAEQAFETAGVSPGEVDVAEVHDACSFAELLQVENLGLCPRGEGGPFCETGQTKLGGSVPVNPSGGLVSKGHPVGATGILQFHELITQLRGEAGERQVSGARIAAAENGGGFWGVEEAVTTVSLLVRENGSSL